MENDSNETGPMNADYFGMFIVELLTDLHSIIDKKHSPQAGITIDVTSIDLIEVDANRQYKSVVDFKIAGISIYKSLQAILSIEVNPKLDHINRYDLAAASVRKLREKIESHFEGAVPAVNVTIQNDPKKLDEMLDEAMKKGMKDYPSYS